MPKRISKIWNSDYYIVTMQPDGKRKATCKFCQAKSYTENASKMQDHTLKCELADQETKSHFLPTKRLRESKACPVQLPEAVAVFNDVTAVDGDHSVDYKPGMKMPKKQTARKQARVDRTQQDQHGAVNKAFAKWIYSANLPLSVTENSYFSDFAQLVCPTWKYPSRFELTNNLLDSEVVDANAVKAQAIARASAIVLQSDGWKTVKGKALINFMAVCDSTPVYLGTIDSMADRHTGMYIANLLRTKMNEIGSNKVYALCTDNAVEMRLAWNLLQEEFPSLVCFGCAAHGLSLYGKEITRIPEIKAAASNANLVLKWLKFKDLPHAIMNEKCMEICQKELAVILSVETRWGSVFYSLTRLLQLRTPIEQTVMDLRLQSSAHKVPEHIRQFVLDDMFWQDIQAVVHLLRPLVKAMLFTESDMPQPGLICHIFHQLKSLAEESYDHTQHFGRDVQQKLLGIWQNCADFCLSDIHFAANILDPRFRGELLTEEEDIKGMKFVVDTALKMTVVSAEVDFQTQIFIQLCEFKTMAGAFSHEFKWHAAKTMHPSSWWSTFHSKNPLLKTATKILNVTPTAASAERNWKRHSLAQTKLRNCLTPVNMQKLVQVGSTLNSQKKQNQELTNQIADLSKFNFNIIHERDVQSPDGTCLDEVDSQLLMDLRDSGQFDMDDLEMSCDEVVEESGE